MFPHILLNTYFNQDCRSNCNKQFRKLTLSVFCTCFCTHRHGLLKHSFAWLSVLASSKVCKCRHFLGSIYVGLIRHLGHTTSLPFPERLRLVLRNMFHIVEFVFCQRFLMVCPNSVCSFYSIYQCSSM